MIYYIYIQYIIYTISILKFQHNKRKSINLDIERHVYLLVKKNTIKTLYVQHT